MGCSNEKMSAGLPSVKTENLFPDVKPMGHTYPDIKEMEDGLMEYYKENG